VTDSYSSLVLEHFRRPLNRGRLDTANASAEGSNPLCGDRIRMECEVVGGRVVRAAFTADACAICIAAASVLSERAKGMTARGVMLWGDEELLEWLEGPVPAPRRRCATLALETLQRALGPGVASAAVRPIVLAAGAGRRFGGDKLVALVDGEPMVRGVVRAYAAVCGRVTVVVPPDSNVPAALEGLPVDFAVNPDPDEGIASSIRIGISSCGDRPAVMIALGDEPRLDRLIGLALIRCWEETSAPVVATRFNGELGHPVLFDRTCFADLLALGGDRGARGLIRALGDQVRYVDVARPHPIDIDTPDDINRL
jgi:molybdenum cofactor cytidylyltransferase